MKLTKLIFWAQTENDSRGTASATVSYEVVRGTPLAIAREINGGGQASIDRFVSAGNLRPSPWVRPEWRVPGWAKPTISYASGRLRTLRVDER
jgi:hypothetical protein